MKKKLISSIISSVLLFSTICCGLTVPVNAVEDADATDMLKGVIEEIEFVRDPETGHISVVEPAVYNRRSVPSEDTSDDLMPNSSVPSKYPNVADPISFMYSKYPNTRFQDSYGTCWAHAAAATAEFDLITNHEHMGYNKNLDLSELQLAYFNYHSGKNPDTGYFSDSILPGLEGDYTYMPSSAQEHYLDIGGNIFYSMHTLSQWKCFTYESYLKYENVRNDQWYNVESIFKNNFNTSHTAAQLRNVKFHDIKNNRSSVKNAIVDQGSVYISYYSNSKYYNITDNTYCCTSDKTTNHDIIIVGWDDSKVASPNGSKGAWLARNSWQESSSGSGSEYTYFWLSYYDASINNIAYSLDFEPYSPADHLYQHDGVSTYAYFNVNAAANVFTANSSMTSNSECLDSVMVAFTNSTNVNYQVQVYTDIPANSNNPTNGTLRSESTTTGKTGVKGIYTIDLKNPVYLSPGERYSIVISVLKSDKTTYGFANFNVETSRDIIYKDSETGDSVSWFSTIAHADKGESYLLRQNTWHDTTTLGNEYGNVCIKAITSDSSLKEYSVTYKLNGGKNNSNNPNHYLSNNTGSFTLKSPTRSGYHFVGWYSDANFTNKVTSINYNDKKNIKLYAKWCSNSSNQTITPIKRATTKSNGSYTTYCKACNQSRGPFTSYKIASIGLNNTKLTYTGNTQSPKPVIKDSKGNKLVSGTDYTYSYNTSKRKAVGRYSVTIKFKGKYYSSDPVKKYFTIVPKAPTSVSAKLYGYDDVKFSWTKCTGASGYAVYYKKASSSKYVLLKRTTKLSFKKANLTDNVKYHFKVVPYYRYKSGSSYKYAYLNSKVASVITLKKLAQPKMYTLSNGRVSLTCEKISGATGYQVYWAYSKNGKYNKLSSYTVPGMSFDSPKGKTYWYKTRAYKTVGKTKIYGPWSTPKSFKR